MPWDKDLAWSLLLAKPLEALDNFSREKELFVYRQAERRLDIQSVLKARGYGRVIDLSAAEKDGKNFEGTGVLVLDRINGVAYVSLSERADKSVAEHWVEKLGYKVQIHSLFLSKSIHDHVPKFA